MLTVHQKTVTQPCVTTFPAPPTAKVILFTSSYKKLYVMSTWVMHEHNIEQNSTLKGLSVQKEDYLSCTICCCSRDV